MTTQHSGAPHDLPPFFTAPGETDGLLIFTLIFLIAAVLGIGVLFLRLHSLPERMAHRTHKIQFEIVAILCLLALFSHNHAFWVAALLLAFIDLPDISTPISTIARALTRIADAADDLRGAPEPAQEDARKSSEGRADA